MTISSRIKMLFMRSLFVFVSLHYQHFTRQYSSFFVCVKNVLCSFLSWQRATSSASARLFLVGTRTTSTNTLVERVLKGSPNEDARYSKKEKHVLLHVLPLQTYRATCFPPKWSCWGYSHFVSLFTNEEQKKAGP